MGTLEDFLPFLQVDELLGQDVHVAAKADPLAHLGNGGAVVALADEFIAFEEGRRQPLAEYLPPFPQFRGSVFLLF